MLDARDRVVNKTDMMTAFVVLTGVPVRAKLIHEISGTFWQELFSLPGGCRA